jgi:hypothetical protein
MRGVHWAGRPPTLSDDGVVSLFVLVHSVVEGASADSIEQLLAQLPARAVGRFDAELRVVVVDVTGDAASEALRVLSGSALVLGGPVDDRAVTRYWPERASRPAYWDEPGEDWDICTTCGWWTPPFDRPEDLKREKERHENDVHAGLVKRRGL